MIVFFARHKRLLIELALAGVLLLSAMAFMEHELELTSVLFASGALITLLYIPFFGLVIKKKSEAFIQSWQHNEIWLVATVLALLCVAGAIEAYSHFVIFTIIFIEILLLLMVFLFVNFVKVEEINNRKYAPNEYVFPKWAWWAFFLGNGCLIVIFEEFFTDKDQYAVAFLFYLLSLFCLMARWAFQQIKAIIMLKNEKTKTELMHLQSQVNPHFFFNMLNNLYGWVGKDTKKAQELILSLSDMMRYSIYDGQQETVFLEEEIKHLKNYIELHKSRYRKKIDVSFTTDIEEGTFEVRPLLFIILLENAFKHGVENLRSGAFVNIDITAKDNEICCLVENNFDSENSIVSKGIGLKNLRRRLELVYPKKHILTLTTTEDIYQARLKINLQ